MAIRVVPLGAGQDVGRSCVLVTIHNKNILFDCGMHMAYNDLRQFPDFSYISKSGDFNSMIDAVIISHFHLDHCGALPYFTEICGYDGPIYMTAPTKSICPILLSDMRKIVTEKKGSVNFFTEQDIANCMMKVRLIHLHETIVVETLDDFGDEDDEELKIEIKCYYAGHVLGAAMFLVKVGNESVVYTGDYNMTADRHLGSAWIDDCRPTLLITETTYATTERDSKRLRERDFLNKVHECISNGGKVLIPVFALGRAQELCILVESYWKTMNLTTPVYFSAGLTSRANEYYKLYISWMNENLKQSIHKRNMFDFEFIKPWDNSLAETPGAVVLFASPGMLHSGMSLDMFKKWSHDPRNMIIMPGYCTPGTVGAKVLAGEKMIAIDKYTTIDVKMSVQNLSFSAHADSKGIMRLIEMCHPENVMLVHGEKAKMGVLKERIQKELGIPCFDPANGCTITINGERDIYGVVSRRVLQNNNNLLHNALDHAVLTYPKLNPSYIPNDLTIPNESKRPKLSEMVQLVDRSELKQSGYETKEIRITYNPLIIFDNLLEKNDFNGKLLENIKEAVEEQFKVSKEAVLDTSGSVVKIALKEKNGGFVSMFDGGLRVKRNIEITTSQPPACEVLPKTLEMLETHTTHLTIVLKLGTSSICDEKTLFPRLSILSNLVETVVSLRNLGHKVVIVSSGAVGVGLKRLNLSGRPKHLPQVQAVAAVGQGRLMSLYDSLFGQFDIPIAQVLLTRDNLAERSTYLNAVNTFRELITMGVVPIVNENDTVSTSEIRFGDNDTLSAITAGMVSADYLFLLTDVDCLYTDNPRKNKDARVVRVCEDIKKLKEEITVTTPGSSLGTGGMVTKLIAADLATAAGCTTIISNGKYPERIIQILNESKHHKSQLETYNASIALAKSQGKEVVNDPPKFEPTIGTTFLAKPNPMIDRKWWILHGLASYGKIYIDEGAVKAVSRHSSLFAAGIVRVEGKFVAHQCVKLVRVVRRLKSAGPPSAASSSESTSGSSSGSSQAGEMEDTEVVIGKGLVNYASHEIQRIQGCKSSEIAELLGYMESEFIIHRDNIVISVPTDEGL
ncbi:Integrator complex subunit 11 [Nowakowskiella sp. JEL0407]|nr:Integrator complex subunit 11 [Nowakowskiella sp. JEL0407]